MESLLDILPFVLIGGVFVWTWEKGGEGNNKNKKYYFESPYAYLIPFTMLILIVVLLAASYSIAEMSAGTQELLQKDGELVVVTVNWQLPRTLWRVGVPCILAVGSLIGYAMSVIQIEALKRHGVDALEMNPFDYPKLLASSTSSATRKLARALVPVFYIAPTAAFLLASGFYLYVAPSMNTTDDLEKLYAGTRQFRTAFLITEAYTLYIVLVPFVPMLVSHYRTIRWYNSEAGLQIRSA